MNKQKIILPISILLGCIILGAFYYKAEIKKQGISVQQGFAVEKKYYDTEEIKNSVENYKKEKDLESELLYDIYLYEVEERSLLYTFDYHRETFCPYRNQDDNIYKILQKKLEELSSKYHKYLNSSKIYQIIDIKEGTLENINYNCKGY